MQWNFLVLLLNFKSLQEFLNKKYVFDNSKIPPPFPGLVTLDEMKAKQETIANEHEKRIATETKAR